MMSIPPNRLIHASLRAVSAIVVLIVPLVAVLPTLAGKASTTSTEPVPKPTAAVTTQAVKFAIHKEHPTLVHSSAIQIKVDKYALSSTLCGRLPNRCTSYGEEHVDDTVDVIELNWTLTGEDPVGGKALFTLKGTAQIKHGKQAVGRNYCKWGNAILELCLHQCAKQLADELKKHRHLAGQR
jgi:hypothetical protein